MVGLSLDKVYFNPKYIRLLAIFINNFTDWDLYELVSSVKWIILIFQN